MSAHPELWSAPAESIGREGMLTVWDHHGGYVGCIGTETWKGIPMEVRPEEFVGTRELSRGLYEQVERLKTGEVAKLVVLARNRAEQHLQRLEEARAKLLRWCDEDAGSIKGYMTHGDIRAALSQAPTAAQDSEEAQMSTAAKFRKKPVEIEAMQWDGSRASIKTLCEWVNAPAHGDNEDKTLSYTFTGETDVSDVQVWTLEGPLNVSPKDWIVRGVQGEFYPVKPDIFAATYDPVQDSDSSSEET